MAISGNKGEWSEIYVLLKLLGDGHVYAGDAELNKIEKLFYPIIKVLRNEYGKSFEYSINDDIVIVTEDGKELLRKEVKAFLRKAKDLLAVIKKTDGSFTVPEIEDFMSEIHCGTLKAKSKDKTDIRIVIHDSRTGMTPLLGFSIKSQVGSNSTLLNASRATNFCYQLSGSKLTTADVEYINKIETKQKILDRVKEIIKRGCSLEYNNMDDAIFKNNLVLIDSLLPQIVAKILVMCYSTGKYDLKENAAEIAKENPLRYDTSSSHAFYEYKIKNLLVASALGMVPHTPWNGKYDANGGYLIVKENGDVLCYHFYDRNLFEDYLFENTKLETPSTSRYDFGEIFWGSDDNLYFNLNLQIRFK